MIKFSNQVPSVYPNTSRDFQYLGWLIDIVLNSVKHNVDDLYNLPNNKADQKLTELLAFTLGFKVKRNYDKDQLYALIAALPRILKYKGTKTAVDMAGNALLGASGYGASRVFSSSISAEDPGELAVVFPVGLVDISLFTDLLEYILPAGMTCHIIRKNEVSQSQVTEVNYSDTSIFANWVQDLDWSPSNELGSKKDHITTYGNEVFPGLANMFDTSTTDYSSANFVDKQNLLIPNVGLLDNSIIPTITTSLSNTAFEKNREEGATAPDYTTEPNEYGTTVIVSKHTEEESGSDTTVIIGD